MEDHFFKTQLLSSTIISPDNFLSAQEAADKASLALPGINKTKCLAARCAAC